MANNRIHLKCQKCNEAFLIAKYTPSVGWYPKEMIQVAGLPIPFFTALTGFLEKHSFCDKRGVMWGTNLTAVREVDDD